MDISFKFTDKKAYLHRGSQKKEIPKDALIEILHITLSHIATGRDYGNITSVSKLLQTIDLECVPDDSDAEDAPVVKPVEAAPAAAVVVPVLEKKIEEKASVATVVTKAPAAKAVPAAKAPAKPAVVAKTAAIAKGDSNDESGSE